MSVQNQTKRRRKPILSACGCLVGAPIATLLILLSVYLLHNRPVDIVIPTPVMPADNAYDDFVRAANMIRAIKHKAPASMPNPPKESEMFAVCKACAEDAGPGLAALKRAFGKTYLNPPSRSFATTFPAYASYREMARTITGVAKFHELNRQPGIAADDLLDGYELGVMMARGGSVIAGSVGHACEAICLSQLEPLLERLTDPDLQRVAKRLERIAAKRVPYSDIVIEESNQDTASWMAELRKLRGPKEQLEFAASVFGPSNGQPVTWNDRWTEISFLLSDKSHMLRENDVYRRSVADEGRKPYLGKSRVPVPKNILAEMGVDYIVHARPSYVSAEATDRILQTEAALLRYRNALGKYPGTIGSLVPACLNRVLDDPFGGREGKPLLYFSTDSGKGYLLYSLGPNMIDDHGAPGRFPNDVNGDIVAGKLWQTRQANK